MEELKIDKKQLAFSISIYTEDVYNARKFSVYDFNFIIYVTEYSDINKKEQEIFMYKARQIVKGISKYSMITYGMKQVKEYILIPTIYINIQEKDLLSDLKNLLTFNMEGFKRYVENYIRTNVDGYI